jgi:hypothetical protein
MRLPNASRSTNTEFSKTVGPRSLSESRSSSSETSVMVKEVSEVSVVGVVGVVGVRVSGLVRCKHRKSSPSKLQVRERRGGSDSSEDRVMLSKSWPRIRNRNDSLKCRNDSMGRPMRLASVMRLESLKSQNDVDRDSSLCVSNSELDTLRELGCER